jgi:hypothetical protein
MKKMRYILFLIPLYLFSNSISIYDIKNYGLSVKSKCINGYLYDEITGKINGVKVIIQQPTCVDISKWDAIQCNHKPIKCKN